MLSAVDFFKTLGPRQRLISLPQYEPLILQATALALRLWHHVISETDTYSDKIYTLHSVKQKSAQTDASSSQVMSESQNPIPAVSQNIGNKNR